MTAIEDIIRKDFEKRTDDIKFRADYWTARVEFNISHQGQIHNADYAISWIERYLCRHYGYKINNKLR